MRAVVVEQYGQPPVVREVADPEPPPGGVVVRVHATGLCRSDWHAWAGHDDGVTLPLVPGHELAGTVVAVAPDVRRWRVGARVTTPFVCGCGRCAWCTSGQAQVCPDQTQPGFTHDGSFAELVALRAADTNLVAVPDAVGDAAAASLGCRFATSYRALSARADLRPGEWVTVVGAGGVGLSAVMIAVARGARVVAVDRSPAALDLARRLGAEHTVLAADPADPTGTTGGDPEAPHVPGTAESPVAEEVHDLTGGGSHVALDAVGSAATCADAIHSLRRRGRHVQVGLLPAVDGHPPVPMDRVVAWEIDVLGSHGMAAADYPAMLAEVERGRLRPQDLLERVVDLDEGARLLPGVATASPAGITVIDPRLPARG